MAILPREAFIWFQDPKFVKDLLNATDDKWENPMRKDITIIETLARNDADIRSTIAHLQRTADQNKVQAYSTLSTMNKQRRMRKFDRVLLTRRQVTNKTPTSSPISQPFVSAPSTPPPLTRDASRASSPPNSTPTRSNSTQYTPYTNSQRLTPANPSPVKPPVSNPSIYKHLKKVVQPIVANRAKATGKPPTIAKRELASQRRLAQINIALQKSQKPLPTPTPLTPTASSSRHTQPPGPLPSQSQTYRRQG